VTELDHDTSDEPAGEHVLVVDDDPFIARLLEIELRAAGYDVRVAATACRRSRPPRSGRPTSCSPT
jgi:PleD family two-component response regulator